MTVLDIETETERLDIEKSRRFLVDISKKSALAGCVYTAASVTLTIGNPAARTIQKFRDDQLLQAGTNGTRIPRLRNLSHPCTGCIDENRGFNSFVVVAAVTLPALMFPVNMSIFAGFGYRRLHVLLKREGYVINHKNLFRLYREEKLAVRRRGGRKRRSGPGRR